LALTHLQYFILSYWSLSTSLVFTTLNKKLTIFNQEKTRLFTTRLHWRPRNDHSLPKHVADWIRHSQQQMVNIS